MTFSKLGMDSDTQQLVYLPKASRLQGLYIIGIQGTGKSGLIENLIMEDINQQIGVCVLDPHGELINHVIARLPGKAEEDKVILLDIAEYTSPFGLNLLQCPDPTDDGEIVKTLYQVLHVFEKAYGIVPTTPLMYDLLYHTVYTLIANPGYTMIDIRLLLTNEACRKLLAANVPNSDIQDFWRIWDDPKQTSPTKQQEDRKTILNKMNDFLHVPLRTIVGQSTSTFDLEDIMNTGKILLVKLSRRLEQPSNLIGSIIIAQLLNAAYARPTNKRKQFHLYADEFQNFATEDFATLLEEARKFGIATTIAHQNRGQLNSVNSQLETDLKDRSRSVGNMVVFKINSKDAHELVGEFKITPQAAWEEELAKEWVEVLKPEWYERVEEEVIDGEEEIQTVVSKPIEWLLSGKTHPNPKVYQFVATYLSHLDPKAPVGYYRSRLEPGRYHEQIPADANAVPRQLWNALLYQVMREKNPYLVIPNQLLNSIESYHLFYKYMSFPTNYPNVFFDLWQDIIFPLCASLDVRKTLRTLTPFFQIAEQNLYPKWLREKDIETQRKQGKHDWVNQKLAYQDYVNYYHSNNFPQSFFDEVNAEVQKEKRGKQEFEQFLIDLREVMAILAIAPILEGSGIRQPRKRKQINYHTHPPQTLTHPRKVIMHPQRTYQDVQNELETQFVSLPNFSARVKIGINATQNPGKKCLSCKLLNQYGANYCRGCGKQLPSANEYILTTLKPASGMNTQQLEQRIKRIQARNLQQKHLRDRKTVEAEITQRQTGCSSSSAPAQPQKQQQQPQQQQQSPRHARNVPVQGKCSKCGKTNPPGSQFCNQCGTKLP